MRTTLDLPDSLYRELKSRAALEGRSVKDVVRGLLQRALSEPIASGLAPGVRSQPPRVSAGAPLPLAAPSNAALFDLLDGTS